MRRLMSLLLFAPTVALAALPPMSPEDQQSLAQVVAVVEIQSTKTSAHTRDKAGFEDLRYVFSAKTLAVLKGPDTLPETLELHTWQAVKRPDGWAGPGGLRGLPSDTDRVLVHAGGSPLKILQPNGVTPLKRVEGTLSRADHSFSLKTADDALRIEETRAVSIKDLEALLGKTVRLEVAARVEAPAAAQPTSKGILGSVGKKNTPKPPKTTYLAISAEAVN